MNNPFSHSCERKQGHKSEGAAEAHKRSLIDLTGCDPLELASYHCVFCRMWHVGRINKKKLEYLKRGKR
jgi:hypothetical protein